jgi:Asp/Glu/hydantoin racemase
MPETTRRFIRPLLLAGCALVAPLAAPAQDAAGNDKIIVLINPNSNADTTRSMTEIAATATGGITVEGKSNEGVPPLLTTPQDLVDALPGVVRIGVEAAKDDRVGAIVIAAFGDPGLAELRAEIDKPVFGIREQAFREAAEGGRPFGIATTTPDPGLAEAFRQTAVALGYAEQFRGTRATPGDPNALMAKSADELDAALAEAVRASIGDGAEAVIIGGGPLTASALRLQPQFDIPLVIPVIAAAEAAAREVASD